MSVHDGERYVRQAIESVLAQTFRDFEFIIIDDGSTDATGALIESFADPRIMARRHAHNTGLTRSLNEGMKAARGVYLARIDADDVSLPLRLETQLEYFFADPSLALCAGRYRIIDQAGDVIGREQPWVCDKRLDWHPVSWHLLFGNHIGHSTVMMKKACMLDLGGYAEWATRAQDFELWSRLTYTYKAIIIPEVLAEHRVHDGSVSRNYSVGQHETVIRTMQQAYTRLVGEAVGRESCEELHRLLYWRQYEVSEKTVKACRALAKLGGGFVRHYRPDDATQGELRATVVELYRNVIRAATRKFSWRGLSIALRVAGSNPCLVFSLVVKGFKVKIAARFRASQLACRIPD